MKNAAVCQKKYFLETKDLAESYALDNEKQAHIENMFCSLENFKYLVEGQDQISAEIYRQKTYQENYTDKENLHPNTQSSNTFLKSAKDFLKQQSSMLNKKNDDVEILKGKIEHTEEILDQRFIGISE